MNRKMFFIFVFLFYKNKTAWASTVFLFVCWLVLQLEIGYFLFDKRAEQNRNKQTNRKHGGLDHDDVGVDVENNFCLFVWNEIWKKNVN